MSKGNSFSKLDLIGRAKRLRMGEEITISLCPCCGDPVLAVIPKESASVVIGDYTVIDIKGGQREVPFTAERIFGIRKGLELFSDAGENA